MIETLTLNQTAAYLRQHGLSISNPALANGIQQGQYPFGICIVSAEGCRSFQIFKTLLDKWIASRCLGGHRHRDDLYRGLRARHVAG